MLTPETIGLSPEAVMVYSRQRRVLTFQYKVIRELRAVWPVPDRVLCDAYEHVRADSPEAALAAGDGDAVGDDGWSQQDLLATVAGQCDGFPNYLRAVPLKDVTPAGLLKLDPARNPALKAYFELLSLMPDLAVLAFPVRHHGNWIAHNLGPAPFPQPVLRAVLPAVAKNRNNIEILPIKTFSKEFSDGKEREED